MRFALIRQAYGTSLVIIGHTTQQRQWVNAIRLLSEFGFRARFPTLFRFTCGQRSS